ncbi:BCCT family transporter [Mesobacillus harenae]|uniref:BCCT family transporter n=1 Tax=Mesobacillus harenae TaxID=2213203 RepID=UPI0015800677|nr:BCCT family transporter [Mesobacillus harenae]
MNDKVTKVFWISLVIAGGFIAWGVASPQELEASMNVAKSFFLVNFGWFYQLSATFFLVFALFLICYLNRTVDFRCRHSLLARRALNLLSAKAPAGSHLSR